MKNISNLSANLTTNLTADEAKKILLSLLQKAYAHRRATAQLYMGYSRGLFISSAERQHIRSIAQAETQHHQSLYQLLKQLHTSPSCLRVKPIDGLGRCGGLLCVFGGHLPRASTGWIAVKESALHLKIAQYAWLANHPEMVPELLDMAEAAWDHANHFGQALPTPRQNLRTDFARFCQDQHKQRIHRDLQRIKPAP